MLLKSHTHKQQQQEQKIAKVAQNDKEQRIILRGIALYSEDPETVVTPEIETEAVLGNVVAAIASTLRPGAMLAFPLPGTTLLPAAMLLPSALLYPAPLVLPCCCLLLGTPRLLLLPGLLGALFLPLLLPLLDPLLR